MNTLLTRVDDAIGLAAEEQLADGYSLLLTGLRYAEERREEGEPWAEELMGLYRLAMENYCSSYGVRME